LKEKDNELSKIIDLNNKDLEKLRGENKKSAENLSSKEKDIKKLLEQIEQKDNHSKMVEEGLKKDCAN